MAKRGPKGKKPKLLRIKSATGVVTRGASRQPSGPRRPQWLVGAGKKEWDRLVRELREMDILSAVDPLMMARYCAAYHEYREADKLVKCGIPGVKKKKHKYIGPMILTQKGNLIQNPAVSLRNAAFERWSKIAGEFEKARANLRTPQQPKQRNDKSRFFGGRKSGA